MYLSKLVIYLCIYLFLAIFHMYMLSENLKKPLWENTARIPNPSDLFASKNKLGVEI